MKRAAFGLITLLMFAASARAQGTPPAPPSGAHGFTVFANMGVGFEHDYFYGGSGAGLAGINFGIGGFVTHKLAILARLSGTVVDYPDPVLTGLTRTQNSAVFGATAQYWATPRVAIEAGGGFGSWNDQNGAGDGGWGLILATSLIVYEHKSHHLFVTGEYAPVITQSGNVHNIGVTFGYQFFRR